MSSVICASEEHVTLGNQENDVLDRVGTELTGRGRIEGGNLAVTTHSNNGCCTDEFEGDSIGSMPFPFKPAQFCFWAFFQREFTMAISMVITNDHT